MNKKNVNSSLSQKKENVLETSIIGKDILHADMVQREQLKTLKELNIAVKDLTYILKEFEGHQFMTIHRSKWKIALYNLSLWILFAIWTVLWLLMLSWSTYHFFKDSSEIKGFIDSQLKIRQFNIQDIKEKVKSEIKKDSETIKTVVNSWTKVVN